MRTRAGMPDPAVGAVTLCGDFSAQRLAALRLRLSEARGAQSIGFDPAYHRQLLDKLG